MDSMSKLGSDVKKCQQVAAIVRVSTSMADGGATHRLAAGCHCFIKQHRASCPDPKGWQRFRSSGEHLGHRCSVHPHRQVHTDLVGKCFNCFSTTLLGVACRQGTSSTASWGTTCVLRWYKAVEPLGQSASLSSGRPPSQSASLARPKQSPTTGAP